MLGPLEQAGCDAGMVRHVGALKLGMKAWVRAPMLGPSSQRSLGQLQQSKLGSEVTGHPAKGTSG